jgi:dTDP-4-amino-4,6-dideoxygalactose transaminase
MILSTDTKFLPFHQPLIEGEEIHAVVEVLRSGWITTGPKVKEFEQAFAGYVGARHALAVNSGTSALHLALDAIGVGDGDEVLVPTMTFAATAEVVHYVRARPVLVDYGPESFNMDPLATRNSITPRTKAMIPVHFGGVPCEMDALMEMASHHALKVVEDAAHAFPARYKGRWVGTIGDITCFSFYATKTITTGEGGMVTTENEEYADRMRIMSLHGISKDAWKRYSAEGSWQYEIFEPGFKYNLTDLQAALGLVQLQKSAAMWKQRELLAGRYLKGLSTIEAFRCPLTPPDVQHAWHLFVILVEPRVLRIHRNQVIEELRQRGIGTSVHFIPLHLHPYYQKRLGYQQGQFPHAENFFDRCVSLPLYPGMSTLDVDRVIEALEDIAGKFRR